MTMMMVMAMMIIIMMMYVIEFDAKCQNTITGTCLILIKEKKFDSKKKKKHYKLRTALPKSVAS